MHITDTIFAGDVVLMRKAHPCGGSEWEVTRVGADIGMRCLTCQRRVMLSRRDFTRQVKRFVRRAPQVEDAQNASTATGNATLAGDKDEA